MTTKSMAISLSVHLRDIDRIIKEIENMPNTNGVSSLEVKHLINQLSTLRDGMTTTKAKSLTNQIIKMLSKKVDKATGKE